MQTTYGKMPATLPTGMLCAVRFPVMAHVDQNTGDGRILDGDGGGSAPTPFSIFCQDKQSWGHDGAEVSGAVYEMTIDTDDHVVTARGFLLDNDMGRKHALYIASGAMRGNSVDLRDVEGRWEEDFETGAITVRFTKWKVGATTGVGTPAFIDARIEITAAMLDPQGELMASILADPMCELVCEFEEFNYTVDLHKAPVYVPDEILASSQGLIQPWAAFHRPESEIPHKIIVDENNFCYGNLGMWDSCHDGIEGQCTIIPRPADGYASFNKPGVLTERGIVETGPIFAYGGHRRAASAPTIEQAYGGTENAWADVRITEGVHGPWVCGVVRPGVADTTVYAARASRISGHWVAGRLKAIVSVNAEGFDVPGTGAVEFLPELAAGFAFSVSDGEVAELVASFPPCAEPAPNPDVPVLMTGTNAGTLQHTVWFGTSSGPQNGMSYEIDLKSDFGKWALAVQQGMTESHSGNTRPATEVLEELALAADVIDIVDDEVQTALLSLLMEEDV